MTMIKNSIKTDSCLYLGPYSNSQYFSIFPYNQTCFVFLLPNNQNYTKIDLISPLDQGIFEPFEPDDDIFTPFESNQTTNFDSDVDTEWLIPESNEIPESDEKSESKGTLESYIIPDSIPIRDEDERFSSVSNLCDILTKIGLKEQGIQYLINNVWTAAFLLHCDFHTVNFVRFRKMALEELYITKEEYQKWPEIFVEIINQLTEKELKEIPFDKGTEIDSITNGILKKAAEKIKM